MTTDQVRNLTDQAAANLEDLRPLLRAFADLLENVQEEEQLQRELAVNLLSLLSAEIVRAAKRLDLDLRDYSTTADLGWDSEGGQV